MLGAQAMSDPKVEFTLCAPVPGACSSLGMWKKTFERESNALYKKDMWGQRTSGKYGDATNAIAHVNAAATITGDWIANRMGTFLFGTANAINKSIEARENLLKRAGIDIRPNRGMYRFKPCAKGCKL